MTSRSHSAHSYRFWWLICSEDHMTARKDSNIIICFPFWMRVDWTQFYSTYFPRPILLPPSLSSITSCLTPSVRPFRYFPPSSLHLLPAFHSPSLPLLHVFLPPLISRIPPSLPLLPAFFPPFTFCLPPPLHASLPLLPSPYFPPTSLPPFAYFLPFFLPPLHFCLPFSVPPSLPLLSAPLPPSLPPST